MVAGTCLFMKLPLAVEGASEMFESFAAGHEASVLLITSVASFKETTESVVILVVPSPWIPTIVPLFAEEVGLDVVTWLEGRARVPGIVRFSNEDTSRNLMVWREASLSVFCPLWVLKFEDNGGDAEC